MLTNRMLATVLFSDSAGSTSLASESGDELRLDAGEEPDRIVRLQLGRLRGKEVNTHRGRIRAMFDGPSRAIQCAREMITELRRIGL